MRHTLRLLAATGFLSLAGCQFGMQGSQVPSAQRPGGATTVIETASGKYYGELISADDEGVVISGGKLMLIHYGTIKKLSLEQLGGEYTLKSGERPDAEKLARLRMVSHFPQGLTPDLRSRLLALSGQSEIQTIQ